MAMWRVRDFHDDDLDAVIRLWDDPAAGDSEPVFSLSELVAAVRSNQPAVVATVAEEVVACAVAELDKDRAWLLRISLSPHWRHRGIGSALLSGLEERMLAAGVHRISCILSSGAEIGAEALEHQGYRFEDRSRLLRETRDSSRRLTAVSSVSSVGGCSAPTCGTR